MGDKGFCVCTGEPLFFLSLNLLADIVDSALKFLLSLFRWKVAAVCRSQALNPILKADLKISKYDLIIMNMYELSNGTGVKKE